MKYIIGLGNPVDVYMGTRHNIGSDLLIQYAGGMDAFRHNSMLNALVKAGDDYTIVLPQSYMNISGDSVRKIEGIKSLVVEKGDSVLVVHDDVDLPLGEIKFSFNSGSGGHNGVQSIIEHIGTQTFSRLRIGVLPVIDGEVRKPRGDDAIATFVLKRFTESEQEVLAKDIPRFNTALDVWIKEGIDKASTALHLK